MNILEELDNRRKCAERILAREKEEGWYNPKFPPVSEYYLVDVEEAYLKLQTISNYRMVSKNDILSQMAKAVSSDIIYEGEYTAIICIHKQSSQDEYLLYVAEVSDIE